MKNYLILPGCDDTNRGDQALIWETKRLAEGAGYIGHYYMIAEDEKSKQSLKEGILNIDYILRHPSSFFEKNENNISYGLALKLKWAFAAVCYSIKAIPLLNKYTRKFLMPLYSRDVKNKIEIFSKTEAAFVKGGGFLHASGGFEETYKIFFFLYHIMLAQSFDIPVYILPNSFGPFNAPFTKKMVTDVLKKCKVVMVRESISYDFLKNTCKINSCVYSDLGFHLNKELDFDINEELKKNGVHLAKGKSVALTVRPYRFPGMKDVDILYDSYKNAIAGFVEWLSKNGFYPVLVEHVYSDLTHEQDMACIDDIVKMISSEYEFGVFSNRRLNCREMKSLYSVFDYTIGTRFHSVIFSLSEQVPSMAITYGGNKGVGIMNDMKFPKYSCPMHDITKDKLIQMFSELINDVEIKNTLSEYKHKLQSEREKMIELLRGESECRP